MGCQDVRVRGRPCHQGVGGHGWQHRRFPCFASSRIEILQQCPTMIEVRSAALGRSTPAWSDAQMLGSCLSTVALGCVVSALQMPACTVMCTGFALVHPGTVQVHVFVFVLCIWLCSDIYIHGEGHLRS